MPTTNNGQLHSEKEGGDFPIIPHIASLLAREVESHSLRDVAAEVGVSHGTIHRIINGSAPDVFTFLKLVKHLGLDASDALENWEKPSECRQLLISFFTPWQRVAFEKAVHALMEGGGWIQCYSTGEYVRFEMAAEELECIKLFLNKHNVPTERDGKPLSCVGRIEAYAEMKKKEK